jgi:hypothetical protein
MEREKQSDLQEKKDKIGQCLAEILSLLFECRWTSGGPFAPAVARAVAVS